MDDIEWFSKNEKEFETLVQTVRISNQDTGMKFVIKKYFMLIIKVENDGKIRTIKSRPNQNGLRKGNLQILEDIGSGRH